MNRSIFFGILITVAASLSGHATIEISPHARQQIRTLVTEHLEECYRVSRMACTTEIQKLTDADLQHDIDTFCGILPDEFPSALTDMLKKQLSRCDNPSEGLRPKIDCLGSCKTLDDSLRKCFRDCFCAIKFGSLKNGRLILVKTLRNSSYLKKDWSLLFVLFTHRRGFPGSFGCLDLSEFIDYIFDLDCRIATILAGEVYSGCYEEALRKSSPKVKLYHRMFLFFDKDIPETDAALFCGEEVFRASLRYERIKSDVQSGTIDGKTHLLADRFYRLANEILNRRNIMACIAEADMKERHFKRYGIRPSNRLTGELKMKIGKEIDFISRMTKKLKDMRNDLNILQKNSGIVLGRTYWDGNWWKPHPVGEKEGREILAEIE